MTRSEHNGEPNTSVPSAEQPGSLPQDLPRPNAAEANGRAVWLNRTVNLTVLLVIAVCCAYLLPPGLFSQRIPYGEMVVGSFSEKVVKATRDYDIPDEETTRRRKKEASESNLPVYDYDTFVAEMGAQRIRSGFEYMRSVVQTVQKRYGVRESEHRAEPSNGEARQKRTAAFSEKLLGELQEHRDELARRWETNLDEESFRAFAEAEFSEKVEREAERLILKANGQKVAEYREALVFSAGKGIVVRRKGAGAVEEIVYDVTNIPDQNEIRRLVETWASEITPELPENLRKAIVTLVGRQVRANLRFNSEETEHRKREAVESVRPVVIQLKKGEKIIGDGERIERRHLVIFSAIRNQSNLEGGILVRIGAGLLAVLVVVVMYGFARRSIKRFRPVRKDALLGALWLILLLGMVSVWVAIADDRQNRFPWISSEALYHAAPFAAGAMLVRFLLTSEAAIVFAVIFSALAGVLVGNSLEIGVYSLIGSLVAAAQVARAKDRADLFRAGLFAGMANAAVVLCFAFITNRLDGNTAITCISGLLGGALAVPILVMGIAPLAEAVFGYTTDIKLLELANLNHPALKELIVQAPGTYHHSIIIGSLVEAAAEAIDANPLLARVCAYYHDIGKGRNPLYFGENQRGENRHENLASPMSALIVKRHVSDGMEMARQYKLPKRVADAIPQHHGTRLVGYFFHKALQEQEGRSDMQQIDENHYRYAGPKPQSREVALVMIADAVEASSRAMQDPTPAKLQTLVQKIVNGIFADGQLDECDLTLRDLNEIARAFYRTLGGIYHTRPDYSSTSSSSRPTLTEVKDGEATEVRPAL